MSGPLAVGLDELPALVGRDLGRSASRTLTQEDVDAFARLTGDTQWIHADPARAASQGGTIAHGLLALSLIGGWWGDLLAVTDAARALNYGLDRIRFLQPIPVGSSLSAEAAVVDVVERPDGFKVSLDIRILLAGADSPAVVATSIVLFQR